MTNTQSQLLPYAILLLARLALGLFRKAFQLFFVFALASPVLIIASTFEQDGFLYFFDIIVHTFAFPAFYIQHKDSINLTDLVVGFAAWSLIFEVVGRTYRFIFKRTAAKQRSHKALHITYLLIYAAALCCVPFLAVEPNNDHMGLVGILLVFFLIGYAAFGLLVLADKIGATLSQHSSTGPSAIARN